MFINQVYVALIFFVSTISIAQVDSSFKKNESNNSLLQSRANESMYLGFPLLNKVSQFNTNKEFLLNKNLPISLSGYPQYSGILEYKSTFLFSSYYNSMPKQGYGFFNFSNFLPKGNPIFSVQYAINRNLYDDKNKLLHRWNCIR